MTSAAKSNEQLLDCVDPKHMIGFGIERAYDNTSQIVVLYADVGERFNLCGFRRKGGVCFEIGIAEQNMIGVAAGLAHEGSIPFAITYAPFITGRVFDQIKANVGEMKLPIKLIGATSGLSGGDLGPLLMCTEDVALMRTIPNLIVASPADGLEIVKCIQAAAKDPRPVYIRITGGKRLPPVYREDYPFEFGRAVRLREGERILVVSTGAVTAQVLEAADRLEAEGHPAAVLNMHTVKPLDTQALDRYLNFDVFVTVEEHSVYGGLGGAVAEYLATKRIRPALVRLGIADRYFAADHYENLLEEAGLSAQRIYKTLASLAAGER